MVLDNYSLGELSEMFVTNACLCRPEGNATPSKEAIRACWPRLKAEIVDHKPKHIIALGNTAAQTILNTRTGITTLRTGPPRPTDLVEGSLVVPTVHPAACLRSSDMFPSLVADIGKVVSDVYTKWSPPVYKVYDTSGEAMAVLDELLSTTGPLALDIECGIDKENDFDHPDRYQMLCVGISYASHRAVVIGERACMDRRVQDRIVRILQTREVICHNGKFDIAGLSLWGPGRCTFDTMLASYCVDERPGTHGLKGLSSEILGCPDYDKELKEIVGKGSYAKAPRAMLYEYNAYDVANTFDLYLYYTERLEREGLRKLHDWLVDMSMELMHLEIEGVGVDEEYLTTLSREFETTLEKMENGLQDIAGRGFNPRSPQQVQAYLRSVDIEVGSTDKDTLQKLIESGHSVDFCERMLEQRRESKLFGTYIKGTRKRLYQSRVHPTLLLHGTVSGRLACRNPNLQNVPRESSIRRLFVPGPGNTFVQGDYSQAELRVVATLSEDKWLKEIFDAGRDIHSEVAARFFGPNFTKDQRVRAKAVVFGLTYGREAASLADEFRIPLSEAKRYLAEFFDAIPEVSAWRKQIKQQILTGEEDLVSFMGRHRRFYLITKENKKDVVKEGTAFHPQANASDICLTALKRLRHALDSSASVRLPVHDSILVECPEEHKTEVARTVKEIMEQTAVDVFTDYVKFPVDIGIGPSWGDLVETT